MMYKLKDFVTKEDLESVGFLITGEQFKAFRIDKHGTTFIDQDNDVLTWDKRDITDLIEKGWVEEV